MQAKSVRLPYAVKLLQPRLCHHEAALRRFFREALAASSIRHPGVVSVVDVGTLPDGTGYYAMELLTGEDLATTLARERRLAWPRVLHVTLQICDAMASVHAHDIVHRDLKPANCFRMNRGDDPDFIKILDFGVAKIANADVSILTGADALIGTVPYMAPELLSAEGAREGDRRADVWATAVLLFELLTGQRPFQADNVFQLIAVITQRPAPPLGSVGIPQDWPAGLDEVLAQALCKDPAGRFADMNELAVALRSLVPMDDTRVGTGAAEVDALARTIDSDTAEATSPTQKPPREGRAAVAQVRQRAAFYVDPASRWSSEHLLLPGGTNLVLERGDLALMEVDAVLCGISQEGPIVGSIARRLCEFGGPEVGEIAEGLPGLAPGEVVVVGGGRLLASHLFFTLQPAEFLGLAPLRGLAGQVAEACVRASRVRQPRVHSLAAPLLFSGATGLPRQQALTAIIEAFVGALSAHPPLSLGVLRIVINDEGEQLARSGGDLIVILTTERVLEHERVQRFALERYRTMAELGEAIRRAIPPRLRPPQGSYGITWSLQWPRSKRALGAGLLLERAETISPREAGLSSGVTLELTLSEEKL